MFRLEFSSDVLLIDTSGYFWHCSFVYSFMGQCAILNGLIPALVLGMPLMFRRIGMRISVIDYCNIIVVFIMCLQQVNNRFNQRAYTLAHRSYSRGYTHLSQLSPMCTQILCTIPTVHRVSSV